MKEFTKKCDGCKKRKESHICFLEKLMENSCIYVKTVGKNIQGGNYGLHA